MPPKKKTTTTVGTRTVSAAILRTASSSPSPGVSRRVAGSGKQPGRNVGAEGVESWDRAALLGPSGSDEANETACQTCPICALVILESTNDVEGHEALLCDGSCNQWYHRWCAGVSKACYEALSGTEDPFFCPSCTATKQQKSILELQSSVRSLSDEVRELKALVATLQKKECTGSEPCLGEQTLGTASVQWSTVVRRKRPAKNSNLNEGMGSGDRKEPHSSGGNKHLGSITTPHDRTKPLKKRIPVTNARRIWGTLKSTTCSAVTGAIRRLTPGVLNENLTIKRKYKANQEGLTRKWWFVVRGDKSSVELLQNEWPKIATQTGWKLEPLFHYDDSLSTTPAPQLHTTSTNNEDVAPSQPPSFVPSTPSIPSIPMTSPPLLQQQSQLDGATMPTTQSNINPSNDTMHTVQFHNPGSGSSSNETEAATTSSSSNTTNTED